MKACRTSIESVNPGNDYPWNDKCVAGIVKKLLNICGGKQAKHLPPWHPPSFTIGCGCCSLMLSCQGTRKGPERMEKSRDDMEDARSWLMLIIACHDLGKACPGFQSKWTAQLASSGLPLPPLPNQSINHAFVSQIALTAFLQETGWPTVLAELVADAIGCHHGKRATGRAMDDAALELFGQAKGLKRQKRLGRSPSRLVRSPCLDASSHTAPR